VAHVQRARHVGRGQQDAEIVCLGGVEPGGKIAARFPDRVPAPLNFGGFEAFCEFHGECGDQVENSGRDKPVRLDLGQTAILAEAVGSLRANLRPLRLTS
jgi:hypothetical protein